MCGYPRLLEGRAGDYTACRLTCAESEGDKYAAASVHQDTLRPVAAVAFFLLMRSLLSAVWREGELGSVCVCVRVCVCFFPLFLRSGAAGCAGCHGTVGVTVRFGSFSFSLYHGFS